MYKPLIFLIFIANLLNAQVYKDTILGTPKYVKEYVEFINNSGPFTFLKGDNAYGHAVIPTPENLREGMRETWFETDFCRYTNNETWYDKNRNIIKEIWYYKSGEMLDEYNYEYDFLGRKIVQRQHNKYSNRIKSYYYSGKNQQPDFTEEKSRWQEEPERHSIWKIPGNRLFKISKFDAISRIDSVFMITNYYNRKIGENDYREDRDSIYRPKLLEVCAYNKDFKKISSKTFGYIGEKSNNKVVNTSVHYYKYDGKGRLIEDSQQNDGKIHTYILQKNGKYISQEEIGYDLVSTLNLYEYDELGRILKKSNFSGEKLMSESIYTYQGNYIKTLSYYEKWGENPKPNSVVFRYKFDKNQNWIECVKNVNGKDLYVWKRKIEYY